MAEFFRGWRRKLGVITIMMALLFTIPWIRSFLVQDTIGLPTSNSTTIGLISAAGWLICCVQYHDNRDFTWTLKKWATRFDLLAVDGIDWGPSIAWLFHVGRVRPCLRTSGVESYILAVAYGPLVASLLFLSCYLVFGCPPYLFRNTDVHALAFFVVVIVLIFVLIAPAVQSSR